MGRAAGCLSQRDLKGRADPTARRRSPDAVLHPRVGPRRRRRSCTRGPGGKRGDHQHRDGGGPQQRSKECQLSTRWTGGNAGRGARAAGEEGRIVGTSSGRVLHSQMKTRKGETVSQGKMINSCQRKCGEMSGSATPITKDRLVRGERGKRRKRGFWKGQIRGCRPSGN